jgi:hypothetical protein
MKPMIELKTYKDPNMEFNVVGCLSDKLYIEEGDDLIVDLDEYSDNEILEWAEENEMIEDYTNEDGSVNIEQLRDSKQDEDIEHYNENPPSYATPNGRAYNWFEDLGLIMPDGIAVVDGPHPGSDWQGVVVNNLSSLVVLQDFLEIAGYKVNFHLNINE